MTKSDVVNFVAESTGLKKGEAEKAVNATLEAIKSGTAKDGKVTLVGFGNFTKVTTKEREGRNPSTGEKIIIKSKDKPKFSASKEFLS